MLMINTSLQTAVLAIYFIRDWFDSFVKFLCVCVCVCVGAHARACMRVCIRACVCVCLHACMCVCVCENVPVIKQADLFLFL